jgi:hypothetical protein
MSEFYSLSYLRDEVVRIIEPTIELRRFSQADEGQTNAPNEYKLPTDLEVDEFLVQCPFEDAALADLLLSDPANAIGVELSQRSFTRFLKDVEGWSQVNHVPLNTRAPGQYNQTSALLPQCHLLAVTPAVMQTETALGNTTSVLSQVLSHTCLAVSHRRLES